jgi:predicted DNA-binding protein with PD1-like motif
MKTHAFRLKPNQDLRLELDNFVKSKRIKAAAILTCVGNLKKAVLRMAGGKDIKEMEGNFEIVSLVGTLESGNSHLHISLADNKGKVFGGHLRPGSIIGVTAEVVIAELEGIKFSRKMDKDTGYDELVVNKL